jgi:hypothetical protein
MTPLLAARPLLAMPPWVSAHFDEELDILSSTYAKFANPYLYFCSTNIVSLPKAASSSHTKLQYNRKQYLVSPTFDCRVTSQNPACSARRV